MNQNVNIVSLNPQIISWIQSVQSVKPPLMPIKKQPISRRKFTKEEDEKLKNLVSTFGDCDWKNVASHMENRSSRQCRERWKHYLSPDVSNEPWTESEDKLLCEKYNEFGPRWSRIAKYFPNRTDITIKNRWVGLNGKAIRASKKLALQQRQKQFVEQIPFQLPLEAQAHVIKTPDPQKEVENVQTTA